MATNIIGNCKGKSPPTSRYNFVIEDDILNTQWKHFQVVDAEYKTSPQTIHPNVYKTNYYTDGTKIIFDQNWNILNSQDPCECYKRLNPDLGVELDSKVNSFTFKDQKINQLIFPSKRIHESKYSIIWEEDNVRCEFAFSRFTQNVEFDLYQQPCLQLEQKISNSPIKSNERPFTKKMPEITLKQIYIYYDKIIFRLWYSDESVQNPISITLNRGKLSNIKCKTELSSIHPNHKHPLTDNSDYYFYQETPNGTMYLSFKVPDLSQYVQIGNQFLLDLCEMTRLYTVYDTPQTIMFNLSTKYKFQEYVTGLFKFAKNYSIKDKIWFIDICNMFNRFNSINYLDMNLYSKPKKSGNGNGKNTPKSKRRSNQQRKK
jgi:hypothetical protein